MTWLMCCVERSSRVGWGRET